MRLTLVGDGTSDRCLVPIVEWIFDQKYPQIPRLFQYAENLPPFRHGLHNRILAAAHFHPCDVLVVHRDAEGQTLQARTDEILCELIGITGRCVPVVPVRMTESWLLLDELAIRHAANNPNGLIPLNLPPQNRWELIPDPKSELFRALRAATGLNGRRLDKFDHHSARHRVAMRVEDFSPLRNLSAFQQFETSLSATMTELLLSW